MGWEHGTTVWVGIKERSRVGAWDQDWIKFRLNWWVKIKMRVSLGYLI